MPTKRRPSSVRSLPLSSFAPLQVAVPPSLRPRARAVLLTPTLPHRVLFNCHLVHQALQAGNGHIPSLVADVALDPAVLERAEADHLPAVLQLLRALADLDVSLDAIGQLLGCHKSEVSRLLKVSASPRLLDAVLRGRLSLSHAKRLAAKPSHVWEQWLSGSTPTVRQIEAVLAQREPPAAWQPDADTKRWIGEVSMALSTSIVLSRPSQTTWRVEIAWTHLAVLQGILERLGAGDATGVAGLPERARVLSLDLDSTEELTSLLQHLAS